MSGRGEVDGRRLVAAHAAATEYYRSHLIDEPRALAYLRSRGIVAATAHATPWTIGYAPRGWTLLRDHLRSAGYRDDELLAAGLVTTARTGSLIDVFRDRVTFPIRDRAGQVVAFTGRDLSGRAEVPKYRNTTTTRIYQKKALLYGLAEQLDTVAQPAAVMLVEGPADVVAVARLRQSLPAEAYPDPLVAVAPCGTALTAEQVALLAAAVPPGTPLVVAFDADGAGQAAIDKSYPLLRTWPGPVEAMALPAGSDPASLVAAGPAAALAGFTAARAPLVDLVLEHRLAPHLARWQTRLDELERIGRDPASESLMMRLDTVRALAPLIRQVATTDTGQAARLATGLAVRLEVNPLTVFEAVYPPQEPTDPLLADDDTAPGIDTAAPAGDQSATAGPAREAIALGAAGFPDPSSVGHEYARACPAQAAAATWVAHDPATGHSAWVIAEGIGDTAAVRQVAHLAAEVAGRVAVLVGAQQAVAIARTAVNAHVAAQPPGQAHGDATIAVLTSFDGARPRPGQGRFTVAWAGDTRAYASTGRWFAPLTVDHTRSRTAGWPAVRDRVEVGRHVQRLARHPAHRPTDRDRQLLARAGEPGWAAAVTAQELVTAWQLARGPGRRLAGADAAAAAAEARLGRLFPDVMGRYATAVDVGVDRYEALLAAADDLATPPARPGDGALTASVRGGTIGFNRIDLPVTQIVLAGRGLRSAGADRLREAVEGHRPAVAVGNLRRLAGPGAVGLVVRPRPQQAAAVLTAARLAAQDQAAAAASGPTPRSASSRRPLALPAGPAPRRGR